MRPRFFTTPAKWRAWLELHHRSARELWVGFYKRGTGRPSITWPESVDQALCFGWIDGVRKAINEASYVIRFTPRRTGSVWSSVNLARAQELTRLGLMRPAGLVAHEARTPARSGLYSYEQRKSATLPEGLKRRLKGNRKAWAFFRQQPAWYRQGAVWWIVSAKKPETRERRLTALIEDSAARRTIKPLTRPARRRAVPPATPDRRPRRPPPRRPRT
jgi:uncharacterized protein YdeI (YjbR/CyaY-like superfamily)